MGSCQGVFLFLIMLVTIFQEPNAAQQFTCEATGRLCDIIKSHSEVVQIIAERALLYYESRCSLERDLKDSCSLLQCRSIVYEESEDDSELCSPASEYFGKAQVSTFNGTCQQLCERKKLNFHNSTVSYISSDVEGLPLDVYWTKALEGMFVEAAKNASLVSRPGEAVLRWQFIGTSSGLMRTYPGAALNTCDFDPRIRPWYVAASTGPINLVILMDASASMTKHGRLSRSKEAAKTILSSRTNFDNVGIVVFGSTAEQITLNGSKGLVKASLNNVLKLHEAIDSIALMGRSLHEEGFREAFDLLDRSKDSGQTNVECLSIIILLTDGVTSGREGEVDALVSKIQTWNSIEGGLKKAFIFAYAVGGYVEMQLPKAIACGNGGVFGHILEEGDIFKALYQYYSFLATFAIDNETVWVEPYEDAFGLGITSTVSKAIHDYNFNPPKLIGVIGIDVSVTDLRDADENWEQTIQSLARQVSCPRVEQLSECQIQAVRISSGNNETQCKTSLMNCTNEMKPSVNSSCNTSVLTPNICQSPRRDSFESDVCCVGSSLSPLCSHIYAPTGTFYPSNVDRLPPSSDQPVIICNCIISIFVCVLLSVQLMP